MSEAKHTQTLLTFARLVYETARRELSSGEDPAQALSDLQEQADVVITQVTGDLFHGQPSPPPGMSFEDYQKARDDYARLSAAAPDLLRLLRNLHSLAKGRIKTVDPSDPEAPPYNATKTAEEVDALLSRLLNSKPDARRAYQQEQADAIGYSEYDTFCGPAAPGEGAG